MDVQKCTCLGYLDFGLAWKIEVYDSACPTHKDLILEVRHFPDVIIPIGVCEKPVRRGEEMQVGSLFWTAGEDIEAGRMIAIDPMTGKVKRC